ncbi:hypothetical protein Nepgr_032314 [Nepenthes gracilis]|uniref:Uncharacterized protein n=1 Tax=Nepenthes gracilis TaxID=150966 RepID=A0AAD3TK28_NEPGR|nr:hypothetical protein Nepgr_032314 [Nepenthes gracilis]
MDNSAFPPPHNRTKKKLTLTKDMVPTKKSGINHFIQNHHSKPAPFCIRNIPSHASAETEEIHPTTRQLQNCLHGYQWASTQPTTLSSNQEFPHFRH